VAIGQIILRFRAGVSVAGQTVVGCPPPAGGQPHRNHGAEGSPSLDLGYTAQIERIAVLSANAYVIRQATVADEGALLGLAQLDGQRPLRGPELIGEIHGRAAAAVSLTDGRVVADPFEFTVQLQQLLRVRLGALRAYSQTPSLPERLRASIGTVPVARATQA
jgi:hypothetical protein